MGTASLQIGRVAQKTGLSVDAIRFYEKSGLLPRPARTQGGYRLYEEREIADLEFIQKAQQLGFSLNEIRELFSIQRHPHEVCEHVRDLIGIDGVAIGFDFFEFIYRQWSEAEQIAFQNKFTHAHFVPDLQKHSHSRNLTRRLIERGFSDEEIERILFRNWMRIFEQWL